MIKDVFACLETISNARGVLFGVDPEIAGKIEKVSDALSAFSQLVLEGYLTEPAEGQSVTAISGDIFIDLTVTAKITPASSLFAEASRPESKKKRTDDVETGIIDILIGKGIRWSCPVLGKMFVSSDCHG